MQVSFHRDSESYCMLIRQSIQINHLIKLPVDANTHFKWYLFNEITWKYSQNTFVNNNKCFFFQIHQAYNIQYIINCDHDCDFVISLLEKDEKHGAIEICM